MYKIFNKTLRISYSDNVLNKVFSPPTIIEINRQIKESGKFENDLYIVTKQ